MVFKRLQSETTNRFFQTFECFVDFINFFMLMNISLNTIFFGFFFQLSSQQTKRNREKEIRKKNEEIKMLKRCQGCELFGEIFAKLSFFTRFFILSLLLKAKWDLVGHEICSKKYIFETFWLMSRGSFSSTLHRSFCWVLFCIFSSSFRLFFSS